MKQRVKIMLWLLPLLGFGLGYAFAHVYFIGLLEPWHFIGKPGENIARIVGVRDESKVLVETQSGKFASFTFGNGQDVILPAQSSWEPELAGTVDPVALLRYYGADFSSLPPLFQIVQLFDYQYWYRTEGKGEIKFAVAADGNLWIWDHQIAGLTGLVYYFYPVLGCTGGLIVVLFFLGARWFRRKGVLAALFICPQLPGYLG